MRVLQGGEGKGAHSRASNWLLFSGQNPKSIIMPDFCMWFNTPHNWMHAELARKRNPNIALSRISRRPSVKYINYNYNYRTCQADQNTIDAIVTNGFWARMTLSKKITLNHTFVIKRILVTAIDLHRITFASCSLALSDWILLNFDEQTNLFKTRPISWKVNWNLLPWERAFH